MKAITESTPISIAVVVALSTGAFWCGSAITELRVKMDAHAAAVAELRSLTKEVASVAKDNKLRLDIMQNQK